MLRIGIAVLCYSNLELDDSYLKANSRLQNYVIYIHKLSIDRHTASFTRDWIELCMHLVAERR